MSPPACVTTPVASKVSESLSTRGPDCTVKHRALSTASAPVATSWCSELDHVPVRFRPGATPLAQATAIIEAMQRRNRMVPELIPQDRLVTSPPPNELRLSCDATLYGAQTQFYPRGRAPSASGAC